jgi:hypothetical protein
MRLLLVAALVLMAGAAVAQTASKPSAATAASPAPGKGRGPGTVLPPAQIAAREKALDAEAKKAREESERRMQARDRKLQGLMKSICKGC